MKSGLTEIVFIMDKGCGAEGGDCDCVGGLTATLKKQRAIAGDCTVTTVLYSDKYEVLQDRLSIHDIKKGKVSPQTTKGGTAFYDAVGTTIDSIGLALHNTPEAERPENVIFVIIATHLDTASYKYTQQLVNEKISVQSGVYSWKFILLGAAINVYELAEKISIAHSMVAEFVIDNRCEKLLFPALGDMLTNIRNSPCYLAHECIERSLSTIRADFEKPKKKAGRPKKVNA